jgi:hypothetical protein
MTTTMQTADDRGRVFLGPRFAGRLAIVREVDATEAVVTAARAVPERDARRAAPGKAAPQGRPPSRGTKGPGQRAGRREWGLLGDAVAAVLGSAGRPMGMAEIARAALAAGLWPDDPGDGGRRLERAVWHTVAWDLRPGGRGRFRRAPGGKCEMSQTAPGAQRV